MCDMTRRVGTYGRFRDGLAIAIVVAVAVGVGWLYLRDEARQQPEPGPSPTATPSYDTARREMEALPVRGFCNFDDDVDPNTLNADIGDFGGFLLESAVSVGFSRRQPRSKSMKTRSRKRRA